MIGAQHLKLLARSHAEAWLVYGTELVDLVDVLQDLAEQTGLVAELGQDAVQEIIAAPFALARAQMVAETALQPDLEAEPDVPRHEYRTPQTTIEAFKHVVRLGNPEALKAWLRDHPKDLPAFHKIVEAA